MDIAKKDKIRILVPELRSVTTDYQNFIGISSSEEAKKINEHNKAERERFEMKSFSVDEITSYFDSPEKCKEESEKIETTAEYIYKILELAIELTNKYLSITDLQKKFESFILKPENWQQYDNILETVLMKDAEFLRTLYSRYEVIYKLKIKLLKTDPVYSYKVFFDSEYEITTNLSEQDKLFYSLFIRLSNIKETINRSFSSTALSNNFYLVIKPIYSDFDNLPKIEQNNCMNEIFCRIDFLSKLNNYCCDSIIVLKEELSNYITAKTFLNNPVSKTLFAIDEDKYNALNFFYSGIDENSLRDDFSLTTEEFQTKRKKLLSELLKDFVKLQEYTRQEKIKISQQNNNEKFVISTYPKNDNPFLHEIEKYENENLTSRGEPDILHEIRKLNDFDYSRTAFSWLIEDFNKHSEVEYTQADISIFYYLVALKVKFIEKDGDVIGSSDFRKLYASITGDNIIHKNKFKEGINKYKKNEYTPSKRFNLFFENYRGTC